MRLHLDTWAGADGCERGWGGGMHVRALGMHERLHAWVGGGGVRGGAQHGQRMPKGRPKGGGHSPRSRRAATPTSWHAGSTTLSLAPCPQNTGQGTARLRGKSAEAAPG
eukprot:scaffold1644_cov357-Prasinococcus_capsulatus_cf.AAC.7